jgi:hypothetical protein
VRNNLVNSNKFRTFALEIKKGDKDMAMNKKFTSKNIPEIVYEVVGGGWLDNDTYVVAFGDMTDVDGDTYHLEVEYHKDEKNITYTRVYDYENVEASKFVSPCFKKQIEEYVLQQVGVLREGSFLNTQSVSLELELDIPKDTSLRELREFLNSLKFEIIHTQTPRDEKIKVLSIN